MNVTFKIMRRSGDKAYILSEITDYDKGLPVVLSASTENGVRIPCDVFPFVDEDDVLAMEFALYDTALAVRDDLLASAHILNDLFMWLFVSVWFIDYRIAKIIVTVLVAIWNFVTRKIFLEKH